MTLKDKEITKVIKLTTKIESCLHQHGAEGSGLYELTLSIERNLSRELIKKIRYIGSVRNKVVHEHNSDPIEDFKKFEDTCESVIKELSLDDDSGGNLTQVLAIAAGVAAVAGGIYYGVSKLMNSKENIDEVKQSLAENNTIISTLNIEIVTMEQALQENSDKHGADAVTQTLEEKLKQLYDHREDLLEKNNKINMLLEDKKRKIDEAQQALDDQKQQLNK